ncbi:MAG TPA: cytochrome c3 family protein [Candidatus Sulfotelmatobacter sp.]|nr:cytochrome c3 family protein [Candidatus Sulfotelmatobacter sp.]
MNLCAGFWRWMMVICVSGVSLGYAGQHPVAVDENSRCLDCHADHATGDHVHAAVTLGCGSCHKVEKRQDVSYVELKPAKSSVCFECHEPASFLYPHLPYASGMCTRCHNPHSSANPHLLKAKVNELCLSCHLRQAGSVPSQYLPTIALADDNARGHPYERHPVGKVRDPLTGEEMSCVSCHVAHGGAKLHQLKMGAAIPEDALNQVTETNDMCRKCHMRIWGLEGYSNGKKKNKKKAN